MCHLFRSSIAILVWASVCGCGSRTPAPGEVRLQLEFPETLRRPPERFHRFLDRTPTLHLTWQTRAGARGEAQAVVRAGDAVVLDASGFPRAPDDELTVTARIWDRTREALPRAVPALTGQARISARDFPRDDGTTVPVRLTLHVGVREYD